jgi:dihydropteroate synthase
VDTQRPNIAEVALSLGAACINDVSGLNNPQMAKTVANYDASVIIMASKMKPGDLLLLEDIIRLLAERIKHAVRAGVSAEKITIDPGVGRWVPEKIPEYDLAILDGLGHLRCLRRPVMAAVSRKSFIGAKLDEPDPARRLYGSLAATAVAIYNGAHIVRTHDIAKSLGAIRMAQAIRGNLGRISEAGIEAEVLDYCGFGQELLEHLRRVGVEERGWDILSRKGAFRVISVKGISFQEAIIIKQEMLARGGDAAISKLALRCDPRLEEILVFGTVAQFIRLVGNLKVQPFRLPTIGKTIEEALNLIDRPERYR